MRVVEIVKRGGFFSTTDTVTLEATSNVVIFTRRRISGVEIGEKREFHLDKGSRVTVNMPKKHKLQKGDTVSATLFFNLHRDRFSEMQPKAPK